MVEHMGYGTFIFFGLICLIGAVFIFFVVPETRNLTLEEMDEVFGDEAGNAIDDRNRLMQIYTELGLVEGGPAAEVHEAEGRGIVETGEKFHETDGKGMHEADGKGIAELGEK